MNVRAFHERNSTISHSSLKHPSCGILSCHRVKECAPFVPIVIPSVEKTLHQDDGRLMLTDA